MNRWYLLIVLALLFLSPSARADWEPEPEPEEVSAAADWNAETDYMARMMEAAAALDRETGLEQERLRGEKLAALALTYAPVGFDELLMLSRLIQGEAGSAWLGLDWKMAVGEVALNRVASPEFPDTLEGVLRQPGQYSPAYAALSAGQRPSAESVLAAQRLLSGERVLCDGAVVFQSNFRQGGGVFTELRDPLLGSTYLCYSSRPELYRQ
ncbi:MAG: cell wall hydrolase [Oscillospiraceae bacterium]|nr:cell wall hydrolase [Oscillospiraceae bacterium]